MKYVIKCSGCGSDKDFVRISFMDDWLECKCREQTYIDAGVLVADDTEERIFTLMWDGLDEKGVADE